MVIENDKQTVRFKAQRILYAILIGVVVILLFYFYPEDTPVVGISKWIIVGAPLLAYLIFLIYYYAINSSYIYFSNAKDLLVFRFFSMRMLGESRMSIEIPVSQLSGLTVESSFFSRRIDLTLYKRTGQGSAKYPPISISLLSRKDREQLLHYLNTLVDENTKIG